MAATFEISQLTISVTDLARSEAFYEALGFKRTFASDPPDLFKTLLERPAAEGLSMVAMGAEGFRIELVRIGAPTPAAPIPAPQIGHRHMAIRVGDLDAAAEAITRAGGAVLPDTRVRNDPGEYMMACDPDGARLLLIRVAG